jgi:hypothetical protein
MSEISAVYILQYLEHFHKIVKMHKRILLKLVEKLDLCCVTKDSNYYENDLDLFIVNLKTLERNWVTSEIWESRKDWWKEYHLNYMKSIGKMELYEKLENLMIYLNLQE